MEKIEVKIRGRKKLKLTHLLLGHLRSKNKKGFFFKCSKIYTKKTYFTSVINKIAKEGCKKLKYREDFYILL